jgi:S1-C subfamily serine protease
MAEMDEQDPRPDEQTAEFVPEQHPTDNLARYGAPVPPPAGPPQHSSATPPTPPRRRGPRLMAVGTALAVVAAAGGAGYALGHLDQHDQTTAGAPPAGFSGQAPNSETPNGQTQNGQTQNGQSQNGQEFGGGSQFGEGSPFSGSGGTGNSPFASANDTPATDTELTGLVRVASTLKYEGGRAAGTGMILTSTGEVVTNHHVVQGSTNLRVTVMSTGQTYQATVVGTDAQDDVAVLQLSDASGLQTVTPDADAAAVGDAVTAVGDANGDTSTFSAAAGKILASGQNIKTQSEDGRAGERLQGLLKLSSDVISGDSGGATYDTDGEVVGMTTAASTGGSDIIGYAIPIAKVIQIAGDLENGTQNTRYEYGSPAFLGLGLSGNTTRVGGVYAGTPAASAGVTAGDTITGVGTTRVRTATQLRQTVMAYSPGDQVRISWTDADGTSHIATVTLMAGPIA